MGYNKSNLTKKTGGKASGSGGQPPKKPGGSGKQPVLPNFPQSGGNAKRYGCPHSLEDGSPCPEEYNKKEHLDRHVRANHTMDRPYICPAPQCSRAYARKDVMQNHARVCDLVQAAGIAVKPREPRSARKARASPSPLAGPSAGPRSPSPPSALSLPPPPRRQRPRRSPRRSSTLPPVACPFLSPLYPMVGISPLEYAPLQPSAAPYQYNEADMEAANILAGLNQVEVRSAQISVAMDTSSQPPTSSDDATPSPERQEDVARIRRISEDHYVLKWIRGQDEELAGLERKVGGYRGEL